MIKNQDYKCTLCGFAWIGTNATCPSCHGVAKSEGEMTKKVLDNNDLKKAMR